MPLLSAACDGIDGSSSSSRAGKVHSRLMKNMRAGSGGSSSRTICLERKLKILALKSSGDLELTNGRVDEGEKTKGLLTLALEEDRSEFTSRGACVDGTVHVRLHDEERVMFLPRLCYCCCTIRMTVQCGRRQMARFCDHPETE
jgi:hypothetical protein